MEVLRGYYSSRLRSGLYNEGIYAPEYSVNVAAVRRRSDYAFGFDDWIHTHFMWKLRQITRTAIRPPGTETHIPNVIVTVQKCINFALKRRLDI